MATEKTPAATPENTPIPGGGSWCWSATAPHWRANTPEQPLQPGDTGALQTTTPAPTSPLELKD